VKIGFVTFHFPNLSVFAKPLRAILLGYGILLAIIAYRLLTAPRQRKKHVAQLGGLTWKRNQFCRGWLITGDTGSGKTSSGIRSLESVVQGFEERAARLEADIKDSQKRASELEAKVGAAFEKEDRYHKLVSRQSEIEEQLDLTKNQAPSQVDAAATYEREENSEKQIPKESVHRAQRAAVGV
jgi:hypothetical protein